MNDHNILLIEGPVIHALDIGTLELIENAYITVEGGRILSVSKEKPLQSYQNHIKLQKHQFLVPGFIDTHHHAPQTQNMGLGLDWQLLDWLEKITFPREESFGIRPDDDIRVEYHEMAQRLLRAGTTTCVYFGSLQVPANKLMVEEVAKSGQRAFIGKVCMDQNSPATYCESTDDNIKGTVEFIDFIRKLGNPRIKPVVTPRFAPTCSMPLMKELGSIAKKHQCHIQTHISENKNEIAWVHELFPGYENYASVYDDANLITENTILAHAIHLTDAEKSLVHDRKASISHCPNSNFAINSGCLCVRDLLNRGIKVALGTDISAGYSPSILDACRQAIIASKCKNFENPDFAPLTAAEAFSLATLGGAIAVNAAHELGNFQAGKQFDALIIDVSKNPQIAFDRFGNIPLRDLFEKFIFCGDDRCVAEVFVSGEVVLKK